MDLQGVSPVVLWLAILLQVTIGVVVIIRYITDINKKRVNAEDEAKIRNDEKEKLRIEQEGRRDEVYAGLLRGMIDSGAENRSLLANNTTALLSAVDAMKAIHSEITTGFHEATDERRIYVAALDKHLDANQDDLMEAMTSFNDALEGRFDKIDPALLALVNDVSHLANVVQEAKKVVLDVQSSVQTSLAQQETKFDTMIGEHSALREDVRQLTDTITVLDSTANQFRELANNVILKLSDFAQHQSGSATTGDNSLPDAA